MSRCMKNQQQISLQQHQLVRVRGESNMLDYMLPRYKVLRDPDLCIQCGVCERSCANEVHHVDEELGRVAADNAKCVNCQRCVCMCPTGALAITKWPQVGNGSNNWTLCKILQSKLNPVRYYFLLWAILSLILFIGIICS